MRTTRLWTGLRRASLVLVGLLLIAAVAAWWLMRGSLPRLDGELTLPGLSAPVSVQRDARGVATIDAANEADAMRALGFVHAQERFFEMDLMRRTAAGELAELFGPRAVPLDRQRRVHRLRARLKQQIDTVAGDRRALLEAYRDGVNAGLRGLKRQPWPYLLLRHAPRPWQIDDTPLVGYAMYFDLQDSDNARELALWRLKPHVSPALFRLLAWDGSSWDAPMVGPARGDAPLPGPDQLNLRALSASASSIALPQRAEIGSNNFAVDGTLTRDGRAILANDMHLTLRVPNIWYRARLRYADARATGGRVDVAGFTLPGLPLVVVGSNGHVAWGFTNSYGDWLDWQWQPACRSGDCPAPQQRFEETIAVNGAPPVSMTVEETVWGPILHRDADGSTWASRWTAHLPLSLTLDLADFAHAASVEEALQVADRVAIPQQNLAIADARGRVAWRLLGPIPQRAPGCIAHPADSAVLRPTAAGCPPWTLATDRAPRLAGTAGRVWTANSRVVDGAMLRTVGDGGYVLGSRARQIRDRLFAQQRFDERDLLSIQLDDRTVFLHRWWQLLQKAAAANGARNHRPALHALAQASPTWPSHTEATSVSYRLVRSWRLAVHQRIADGLAAPARIAVGADFAMPALPQLEAVAWPMLQQQPMHLLPSRFASWDALLEDAAAEVMRDERAPLSERTWGEFNTARICHPLAGALPGLARQLLCMPAQPLRGDTSMPRVATPDMGASQRMVVAPGHEADGIVHMPGGQSGHPLSPYWGLGHDDWVQGRPTPFLPGAEMHRLVLKP